MPGRHATLALFAKFISRNLALRFADDRLLELEQKLRPVAREAGYQDLEEYLHGLMAAPLSRQQLETLARALTIGETYFLRDPRSYQVLEQDVLPELIAQRRGTDRSLRIWSAGCSSGEEPYTLAILLSRLIPDLERWKISLVGTDINPHALERGRQGVYSKWSFRNAPAWLMEYFTRRPDGRFQIIPRIKAMVRFDYLNLADDPATGAPVDGTDLVDVIFCRNVMLYFEPAQIGRTVARFHGALSAGGSLFVGPTEVDQTLSTGFTCRRLEGAFVLRKEAPQPKSGSDAPQLPEAPAPQQAAARSLRAPRPTAAGGGAAAPAPELVAPPIAADGPAEASELYLAGRYEEAALSVRRALAAGPQSAETLTLGSRALANIGRFAEARELCEQAIASDRLNAQSHYLLSIILEQQGELEAAAAALKNVLFIDQDYLLAYFALGNLFRQAGDAGESQRNFANALRLLERRDPHEVLPEAEGLTAGRLAQMIRDMTQVRSAHGRG